LSWFTRSAALADVGAGFSYRHELQICPTDAFCGQALSAGRAPDADMSAPQEAVTKRASREIDQAMFSTFEMLLISKFVSALMASNHLPAK
jgi:hypothetical protein